MLELLNPSVSLLSLRSLMRCLCVLGALTGLPTGASAQEAVGENVLMDPVLDVGADEAATTTFAGTQPMAEFDTGTESLKTARRRMGLCGAAIGLGAAGVVLSIFVGSQPRPCMDGVCEVSRVVGAVISSTVATGGVLGLIPASMQLKEAKRARERALRWDPAGGRFVF